MKNTVRTPPKFVPLKILRRWKADNYVGVNRVTYDEQSVDDLIIQRHINAAHRMKRKR